MINAILEFSVRQRMLVLTGVAFLIGFGLFALKRIPIDAFPDVTNVQVQVLATAGGMSPPEVEKLITWPIEIQMGGLPRLEEIRSVSKIGLSVITIAFEDGVNDYFARQLVSERLQDVRGNLPTGVEVSLGPITTGLGEVFQYTLESRDGNKHDATELRTIQDYIVRPLLRSTPGVADVNSFGGLTKQYQVIIQPERLLSYGLTLAQVFEALEKNNSNASGNFIEHHSEQYVVRGLGLVQNLDDIRNIVVGAKNHAPIYISDVAEVKIGAELRQGAVTMNGRGEAVAGIVMMLKGGSGRDVVKAVKARLPEIQKALPDGVTLNPFYDRTDLVKHAVGTVTKALGEGAIFVLLILIILLADVRSALIVTLVLPLAVLFAFIMMQWHGLSANLMSLGGLAIGIGMMVDGAVVMVENIHRHLSEEPPETFPERGGKTEVVLQAAKEVGRPIVFGIFIIILVFLPLFTLRGFEGKMFTPLAFTISFALLGALILSLTFVPMLCTFLLRQVSQATEPFYIRWLKQSYATTLQPCIWHPWRIALAAFIALGGSLALVPWIGTEFLPPLDEGSIAVQTFRLPSISLSESLNLQTKAEKILKQFPEVIDVISKTGRADIASDPMGVEVSDVIVTLKPHREWTTTDSKEELVEKMREKLAELPGVASSFSQPIALRVDELVSGVRSAIGIKIFGEDLDVLKEKADEVARLLSTIPGAADINAEKISGLAYLQIEVDRPRIARLGINVADVQDVIETAIGGKEASKVYEGLKVFGLAIRFPKDARDNVESIREILIPSPTGAQIPLGQLARVYVAEGPAQISRERAQRRIVVECNVTGRDLGSFVRDAREKMDAQVQLPPGYLMTWGGQFENQERANQRFALVVPLTIAGIFLLLFASFRSARQALLIILNIPFAMIGGLIAIVIGGFNLSVSASVGFIALFGVAVLNGIVMVSYFNELRQEGMAVDRAVLRGAVLRLRPVLITASVAALGLLPMLFATGPGSEIQKPLAAVVIGGLVTSTLLTLYLLPTLYNVFEKGTVAGASSLPNSPPAGKLVQL